MFFDSWSGLLRVVVVSVLAYAALVLLLGVSGKRTLSKLSAFDLVVTVALGSTLATILLSKDVALAEGVTAFAMLIALQYGAAWTSVRSRRVSAMIKSEPTLLLHRGRLLEAAMRRERITAEEVHSAVRGAGRTDLTDVAGFVLETDGSLTVTPAGDAERPSLSTVPGAGGDP